ncbi:TPA: hypothetical protein N1913_005958, partial [Pseudomonas aeruginosa 449A]|nr:hypothetical protein [Pseudomonas aeruginosa 449A]
MRRFILTSLLALPSVALPTLALAAPQFGGASREQVAQQLEARFKQADASQDGKPTEAEAQKGMPR